MPNININRRVLFGKQDEVVYDLDALVFISNWETNTEIEMQKKQRLAVNELYKNLKGLNTINKTDFWTEATTNGARIFPLVPLSNATANAKAYELDMVSNGVLKGTYNGFVAGDFTSQGVIGGTGKYFTTGVQIHSSFNAANVSMGIYSRSNISSVTIDMSQNGAIYAYTFIAGNELRSRFMDVNDLRQFGVVDSLGLIQVQNNATTRGNTKNNIINPTTRVGAVNTTDTGEVTFHAYNNGAGTINQFSLRQLCLYHVGMNSFNQTRLDDWYQLWQRFQTNVVNGGRQV
jgi:hypothetical protein